MTGAALTAEGAGQALPPLRDDLALMPGPRAFDGAPTWTIHDPVRNRYFRLGRRAFELLSRWSAGDGARAIAAVNAATTAEVGEADLEQLLEFLDRNDLLAESSPGAAGKLAERKARQKQHWTLWLLKNYLFIRIPLVHPDSALRLLLPLARPLFGRGFLLASLGAAVLGLVLAARQWDAFIHSFLHFLSWQGVLYYAAAILFAKVAHELGHAFAARLAGCRVPTMGLAFLVLWPVLYTDVSDAWRLPSRFQRLRIGMAGMGAELVLAAWATLAWSFLPDGALRSACFLLATVTWLLTLAVNLNPFLRFDGYYLLSDWLGVQNLQERGFALGRWRLRRALFGLDLPKPERLGPRLEGWLILYAYSTWIWRFFLFLGIALLVYHLFFKLLGLFLMTVELGWFIGRPLAAELRSWWRLRDRVRPTLNLGLAALLFAGLLAALAVPWQGHLLVPALIEARHAAVLYPPVPARVEAVLAGEGAALQAGAPVYRLSSPQLDQRRRMAALESEALQHEILRRSASRRTGGDVAILEQQLAETLADLRGLRAEAARLAIDAPAAGTLVDIPAQLAAGRWVAADQPLGRIVDRSGPRLTAYVTGEELARISPGARVAVYLDGRWAGPLEAEVAAVDEVGLAALQTPALASAFGGPIAVRRDRAERLVPVDPVYRVQLAAAAGAAGPARSSLGVARIEAAPESVLARLWRSAASVFIREGGF